MAMLPASTAQRIASLKSEENQAKAKAVTVAKAMVTEEG